MPGLVKYDVEWCFAEWKFVWYVSQPRWVIVDSHGDEGDEGDEDDEDAASADELRPAAVQQHPAARGEAARTDAFIASCCREALRCPLG